MRIIIYFLLLIACHTCNAQGFYVKSFKMDINDGSAFHAPIGADNNQSGLIKVQTTIQDLSFEGNIVGTIENKVNEYWVFLQKGSQKMVIKRPEYLPFEIDFTKYGIDEVSPKATYKLVLKENNLGLKNQIVLTIQPKDASLYIDSILIDNSTGSGYYKLYLTKGEHLCRVQQEGYRTHMQVENIGKGACERNIELESVMSELEVHCKTDLADLYIDDKRVGNGEWKGEIPAGIHRVKASKERYITYSVDIQLEEKEKKSIQIPLLSLATNDITIITNPSFAEIFFDGLQVGRSPVTIKNTELGIHNVKIEAYGCIPLRKDIEIKGDESEMFDFSLLLDKKNSEIEKYKRAYSGDTAAIKELAAYSLSKATHHDNKYYEEAVFWLEKHPKGKLIKTVEWLILFPEYKNTAIRDHDWIDAYRYIGRTEMVLKMLEARGDYYLKTGDKQVAATFYKEYLEQLDPTISDGKNVKRKLEDIKY